LGKLTKADLELTHRATGQSLAHCMTGVGARIDRIEMQEPLLDIGKARAYFELHIEQGPVMVAKAIPLGVVPGIRGNTRHNKIICIGEAGHSGAVPRWLRHDAVLAVSELLSRMDEHWRELLQRGDDLVITAGIFSTDPAEHAISRIPGFVNFSFEARSKDAKTLENVYKLMRAECERIAIDRGVRFEFDRRLEAAPAVMDPQLCALLSESCRRNNISYEAVPSGAGHDASLFANAGVPTGMLFVRNEHGSHNPAEAMDINDFMMGVQVLFDVVSHL
jgi:beta-ureidopropionase / N-carbamoyl-L-amino-acid hydrolase